MSAIQIKNGFNGGSDDQLLVNPDGSINVNGGGGSSSNASVGPTGVTAPISGTEIAGIAPNGNLKAISVDSNGFLNVNGTSVVTGTVTSDQAGLNAFQTSQYAVSTTAIQIAPTSLANRSSISIMIEADPNVAIYIGNSSAVTVNTGYPLFDGSTLQLDLTPSGSIWAISTIAGQKVSALEIA